MFKQAFQEPEFNSEDGYVAILSRLYTMTRILVNSSRLPPGGGGSEVLNSHSATKGGISLPCYFS